jgi:hypothetical protein
MQQRKVVERLCRISTLLNFVIYGVYQEKYLITLGGLKEILNSELEDCVRNMVVCEQI